MASLEVLPEVGSGRGHQQTSGVNVTSHYMALESIHDESTSTINVLRCNIQSDSLQVQGSEHHDSGRQQTTPTTDVVIHTNKHFGTMDNDF